MDRFSLPDGIHKGRQGPGADIVMVAMTHSGTHKAYRNLIFTAGGYENVPW